MEKSLDFIQNESDDGEQDGEMEEETEEEKAKEGRSFYVNLFTHRMTNILCERRLILMKETTKKIKNTRRNPRIVVVPHYVGTKNAGVIFKNIFTDDIRRKIEKSEKEKTA